MLLDPRNIVICVYIKMINAEMANTIITKR